ncbi:MAG: hypothetical protein M1286_04220 [Candidatus Marsarchaeota archaeon]|nr:hypothetical protein [Candidatus Marsarchaeota archaeon]
MGEARKYKVTLSGNGFSYTVVVEADEKTTMGQFKDIAAKKIKEQYGFDLPKGIAVDIEFERA